MRDFRENNLLNSNSKIKSNEEKLDHKKLCEVANQLFMMF
jgi:hypothetical protein